MTLHRASHPLLAVLRHHAAALCCAAALGPLLAPALHAAPRFKAELLQTPGGGAPAELELFTYSDAPPGPYRVEVVVNGLRGGSAEIQFVSGPQQQLQACLSAADWARIGLKPSYLAAPDAQGCLRPERGHEGLRVAGDALAGRLEVELPSYLAERAGQALPSPAQWDAGIPALFLEYDFNADADDSGRQGYLGLQAGLNVGAWRLRQRSVWQHGARGRRYDALATSVARDIPAWGARVEGGDVFAGANLFAGSALRGLALRSDAAMQAQREAYYLRPIRGLARSPAVVSVYQQGQLIHRSNLPAGPFELGQIEPLAAGGAVQVEIREADGHSERFTVSGAEISRLLQAGERHFELALGRFQHSSVAAQPALLQAYLTQGLSAGLSAYGGLQLSPDYRAIALGGACYLGLLGLASFDATQAHTQLPAQASQRGHAYRAMLTRSIEGTGTQLRFAAYRYAEAGFYTLEEALRARQAPWSAALRREAEAEVSLQQALGRLGTLALSYNTQRYRASHGPQRRSQLDWHASIGPATLQFSVAQHRGAGAPDNTVVALNLSLPLGNERHQASLWLSSGGGSQMQQLGLAGTPSTDSRWRYTVNAGHDAQRDSRQGAATLNYRGQLGEAQISHGEGESWRRSSLGLAGTLLVHEHGLTLGRHFGEAAILVHAEGGAGIEVDTGVHTDARGYALLPYASPYRENRVSLAPESLGPDLELSEGSQTLVPTRGALVAARFHMLRGHRLLIRLQHPGRAIPFASQVELIEPAAAAADKPAQPALVGVRGEVYLAGMPASGTLRVRWGRRADQQCRAEYRVGDNAPAALIQLEAQCLPVPLPAHQYASDAPAPGATHAIRR